MRRIKVTINQECIERLQSADPEVVEVPESGVTIEFVWSDEKLKPAEFRHGAGCFVEVER